MFSLYGLWWSLENKIHAKNRDNCVLFSISFLFLCISGWKLAQWTWGSLPPSTAGMMNSLQSVAWSWSWFFMCVRMYDAKHCWKLQNIEIKQFNNVHALTCFFLQDGFRSILCITINGYFVYVGIQAVWWRYNHSCLKVEHRKLIFQKAFWNQLFYFRFDRRSHWKTWA